MTTPAGSSSSAVPKSVPLAYTIASSTPHSGKYVPENIMVDKPQDQSSRWSGALQGNATDQWIILRLESLSVLEKITFGKFSKIHPCNVKEIKVFAGITEDHMSEVLHAGLKNDATAETFNVQYLNNAGVCIPTQFVKIMPMSAHGQNFHISIWHIAMTGIVDSNYIEEVRTRYNEYREAAVLRHILKHLRERRLLTPYQTILSRADIQLEHPLVTQLHESLVLEGDWSRSEKLLDVLSSSGLFDGYLQSCQPHAIWTRLLGTDADGDVPPARGGHAMCIDPVNEMIYIFGGWDGEKSMDDFWVYDIKGDKWQVLSHGTSKEQNAPGARSCHKMVFDTKTGSIYLLGGLNDADGLRAPAPSNTRTTASAGASSATPRQQPQQQQQQQPSTGTSASEENTPKTYFSEFYRYHTRGVDSGKWDFLAFDTASSGGPPLIFDHQMTMDCEAQILYIFGGRVVDGDWDNSLYSGLFSYNVRLSRWRTLQLPETPSTQGHPAIPPRFGHSMVLDPTSRTLYIFAGQRDDRYLSDMYAYEIDTGVAKEIFSNFSSAGGPDACFTQRAVIDPNLKELYVFCGLTRTGARNTLRAYLSNWVYRYGTRPGKWTQILRQPGRPVSESPLPRFAHQVVYNPFTRSVFLHGGNAGNINESIKGAGVKGGRDADGDGLGAESEDGREAAVAGVKERRLDDFWRMELKRPGPEEIVRQAKFHIRRQQFREMCEEAPPVKALNFLQNEVSGMVDHKNAEETEIFRSLLTHLLAPAPVPPHTTEKMASASTSSHPHRHSPSNSSNSSNSTTTSLEHEDSRESSSRPRKRSRADPEEGSEGGVWTNEIAGLGSTQRLQDMVDPLEATVRGGDGGDSAHPLTGARYSQRTEVFEHLLKFIADAEKQPSDSLLDFVGRCNQ